MATVKSTIDYVNMRTGLEDTYGSISSETPKIAFDQVAFCVQCGFNAPLGRWGLPWAVGGDAACPQCGALYTFTDLLKHRPTESWRLRYFWWLARIDSERPIVALPFTKRWWRLMGHSIVRPLWYALLLCGVWDVEEGYVFTSGHFTVPWKSQWLKLRRDNIYRQWWRQGRM